MPVFNGTNEIQPGYYSYVNTSGLVNVGILASGVLAIEGPALGGVPLVVQTFTDPTSASRTFRGGDLLLAMQTAFNEGASLILAVRTGTAGTTVTQSSLTVPDSGNANFLTFTSIDYGSYTTGIQVKTSAGSISGFMVTLTFVDTLFGTTTVEVFDNLASMAAAVTAINAASGGSALVTASDSGPSVNTAVPVHQTNFLAGGLDDPTPSVQEWTNALTALNQQQVNIVNLAGVTDPTVYALLQSHVNVQSNLRKKRIGIVGSALGLPVGVYTNPDSLLGQAYDINDFRIVYCGGGVDGHSGAVTASHVAGWLSGNDVATAITHQNLDVTSLEDIFDDPDKDALLIGGVLFLEQVPVGRRVVRSITTAQDLVAGVSESPFKEISIVRTVDNVDTTIQQNLEAKYIGQKGITANLNSMASDVTSLLSQFKENNDIQGFRNVSVVQNPENPEIVTVIYALAPVFPINWIFSTINLVNII